MKRTRVTLAMVLAAGLATAALGASSAVATTLPQTTYFYKITLTDHDVVIAPRKSVKPGSLIVFTVRNASSHARNLVFGSYKTGFIRPGKRKEFELNFLVPWSFETFSAEQGGAHKVSGRFICSW
jgi:hypothetical protein